MSKLLPGLYPVATPIGNLQDLTFRALAVLKAADVIACEDTRHSVRLLKHYEVPHKPLLSLNEHNEARRIPEIIARIQEGASVALVSDAGTPTVSDPGQRLVHAVAAVGLRIEGIPGPSAVTTALSACGLPTTPFYFGGFLPHKKGQRTTALSTAIARDCTTIFFESPYRLLDTLQIIAELAPDHQLVVARELTKVHETYHRGTAKELSSHFAKTSPKGEICLLIAPSEAPKWMSYQANEKEEGDL
ncbi:MAG: 16S rRNA (cytidine(1402)-2'-O)-methyltransferase [Verrucomicrobiaceae bacterium]|nr:16S rRNA (cytidine(1402)-2'-O)-methyltransferase [Verrucomicrobiaceae bacterium]